jgi:hypothetical protein
MKTTDEKLRELAAKWSSAKRTFDPYNEGVVDAHNCCADELLSILDIHPVREGVTDAKDAARYRFLRDSDNEAWEVQHHIDNGMTEFMSFGNPVRMDESIDTDIAALGEKP